MKSKEPGKGISSVEVSNISPNGVWLLVEDCEYCLSYKDFPWFKKASIQQVQNVRLLNGHHLYWKDLDVDLEVDSLKNLSAYPLKYVA